MGIINLNSCYNPNETWQDKILGYLVPILLMTFIFFVVYFAESTWFSNCNTTIPNKCVCNL